MLENRQKGNILGRSLYKIKCPSGTHEDRTPSCSVYEDGSGYCHACNRFFSELDKPSILITPKPKEDLGAKLTYISTLDKIQHRGLEFPADKDGYYVVWPDFDYYKLRRWEAIDTKGKYSCPSGHSKPWFNILPQKTRVGNICIIVEGEINALSIAQAYPTTNIYSPGGVGNFTDNKALATLPLLHKYDQIHIVADADTPGVNACIKLKKLLQPPCLDVVIHLMEEDANTILINKGVKGIKDALKITRTLR